MSDKHNLEPEYIITADMLSAWRSGCVDWKSQEDSKCYCCDFRGTGSRKGCCEFDDDAMQKIFQSCPRDPAPETKQAYRNGFDDGFEIGNAQCEIHHQDVIEEAATKPREEVLELLDDLRKYAKGEYTEADISGNEREMRTHLEYENRIWGVMKSLRSEVKKP